MEQRQYTPDDTRSLSNVFERMVGRAASASEIGALFKIKDALQISETDPFWVILIALEHYKSLYEKIPDRINEVAARVESIVESLNHRLPAPLEMQFPALEGLDDSAPAEADTTAFPVVELPDDLLRSLNEVIEGASLHKAGIEHLETLLAAVGNEVKAIKETALASAQPCSAIPEFPVGQLLDHMDGQAAAVVDAIQKNTGALTKRLDALRTQIAKQPATEKLVSLRVLLVALAVSSVCSAALAAVFVKLFV